MAQKTRRPIYYIPEPEGYRPRLWGGYVSYDLAISQQPPYIPNKQRESQYIGLLLGRFFPTRKMGWAKNVPKGEAITNSESAFLMREFLPSECG